MTTILVARCRYEGSCRPRSAGPGAARWGAARQVVAAAVLALLAGCSGATSAGTTSAATEEPSPLAGCEALTAPPPAAAPLPPGEAELALPALTLPCLTGGEPFPLADLRGPAVVNLWASWCGPCRAELPMLQEYADRAAGAVHVVGVVVADTRPKAFALAEELGVTFPAVEDPDEQLLSALGLVGLPATLFVDDDGGIRHLQATLSGGTELRQLAADHLGVSHG